LGFTVLGKQLMTHTSAASVMRKVILLVLHITNVLQSNITPFNIFL